jgi:hypothetical protein
MIIVGLAMCQSLGFKVFGKSPNDCNHVGQRVSIVLCYFEIRILCLMVEGGSTAFLFSYV